MSKTLSSTATAAVAAENTGEVFLAFLELYHESMAEPIRVVRDMADHTSLGELFYGVMFDLALPDDHSDAPPSARVQIQNVDQEVVRVVRSVSGPVTATLYVALAATPDTMESGPWEMTLREVEYDVLQVTGDLSFWDILNQGYPAHSVTPGAFPGVFA